jgi:hypothetical protein
MTSDRMREIGCCGGCGLIAQEIILRRGGVPLLRYGPDGVAVHAAVLVGGTIYDIGEGGGLVEVSPEEFRRACRDDFYPDRLNLRDGEIDEIVTEMLGDED